MDIYKLENCHQTKLCHQFNIIKIYHIPCLIYTNYYFVYIHCYIGEFLGVPIYGYNLLVTYVTIQPTISELNWFNLFGADIYQKN